MRTLRVASSADRHLLVQSVTLTPEDYSGRVSIDATPTGPLAQLTDSGITETIPMAVRNRPLSWIPGAASADLN